MSFKFVAISKRQELHKVNEDEAVFWCSAAPVVIHHSPLLPLSFTPGLKPTCFTNHTHVVSLLPPRLLSRTIP